MTNKEYRRIYLIRHGETDWNRESRVQGWADVELNATGKRQAEALGEYVRSNLKIDRVVSSDLKRCTQTADALGLPYETDERLREFNAGELTGLNWREVESNFPNIAVDILNSRTWTRRPAGESSFDTAARAAGFVHDTGLLRCDEDIALVSHGGLIRAMVCVLLDFPLVYSRKLKMTNTGITTISQHLRDQNADFIFESLNCTGHLDGLHAT